MVFAPSMPAKVGVQKTVVFRTCRFTTYHSPMVKALELAIAKAAELPEAGQEQIGRDPLARIDALAHLRTEVEIGFRELDAGQGDALDIEDMIRQAHAGG